MGGTTLHAGIVAQWFEILLLYLFWRYVSMIVNGILFGNIAIYISKKSKPGKTTLILYTMKKQQPEFIPISIWFPNKDFDLDYEKISSSINITIIIIISCSSISSSISNGSISGSVVLVVVAVVVVAVTVLLAVVMVVVVVILV